MYIWTDAYLFKAKEKKNYVYFITLTLIEMQ